MLPSILKIRPYWYGLGHIDMVNPTRLYWYGLGHIDMVNPTRQYWYGLGHIDMVDPTRQYWYGLGHIDMVDSTRQYWYGVGYIDMVDPTRQYWYGLGHIDMVDPIRHYPKISNYECKLKTINILIILISFITTIGDIDYYKEVQISCIYICDIFYSAWGLLDVTNIYVAFIITSVKLWPPEDVSKMVNDGIILRYDLSHFDIA